MKKLFTLALIGVFSTITLTSCSNTGTADSFPEVVNQTKQSEMKASAKNQEEILIENAIKLVKYRSNLKTYKTSEFIDIDPVINEEGQILCSTNLNESSGTACVWNSSGNLVKVTWKPVKYLQEYTDGQGVTPPDPKIVYSGTVVSQCNC